MGIPVKGAAVNGKLKVFLAVLLAVVIACFVTTGVLMHKLMMRMGVTECMSDKLVYRINILESSRGVSTDPTQSLINEIKIQELESKIDAIKATHDADFQVISNKLQTLDDRISQLESDGTGYRNNLQTLNGTSAQLAIDISTTGAMIQSQEARITQLEYDRTKDRADIGGIQSNLTDIASERASDRALMEKQTNSLIQLQMNLSSQSDAIDDNTLSLMDVKADVENDRDTIANISDRTAILETTRQSDVAMIDDNSKRLLQLEQHRNGTDNLLQNLEKRVSYLEDNLFCTWGNWTMFSKCSAEGTQYRERVCESENPDFDGLWCSRNEIDIQGCTPDPATGNWGSWSSYSNCSQPCGGGNQTRQRFCDNPSPPDGGAPCPGGNEESQACNPETCPVDCSSATSDGIYWISPKGLSTESMQVYCEYHFNGPWTVIQRRFDGSENFYRDWATYKTGFGNISGEYWLGNDAIHDITSRGSYQLKIRLTDWNDDTKHAEYSSFFVFDEINQYRVSVYGYGGDADFTEDSMDLNHGCRFSTFDAENDEWTLDSCAIVKRAAWWFRECGDSSLNGEYYRYPTLPPDNYQGILWKSWHGNGYSLKETAMLIQRI